MTSIHDWSIKKKLSLIVILSCILATLLGFIFFITYEVHVIKREMVDHLFTQIKLVEYDCIAALDYSTPDASDALNILGGNPTIVTARLYKQAEKDSVVTYTSGTAQSIPPLVLFDTDEPYYFDKHYLHVKKSISYDLGLKEAQIYIVSDLTDLKKRIRNILSTTVLALVISLVIAYLLAMRLMLWITQPFSHLSETARIISREGNYAIRARKFGNDEIGRFVDVFNGMLDQIQKQNVELRKARDELEARVERRTAELHRTNRELQRANDQLLELDRMKSAFVSQASHDLRTPLTTIKLNLDNLMRGVGGNLSEKQQRVLERAQGAVNRLTHLINDVLDLNRIESGRMILDKTHTPFDTLIQNVIKENQPAADQKHITLDVRSAEGEYYIQIDAGKMERVVGELIGNAIKYTPNGGRIDASLNRNADSQIILTVTDTGIGMTKEDSMKIWDRFYRTATSQQIAVGSGLGLSIAKELVQLHGGSLTVESEPGKGSIFTLVLSNPTA